ncbi:hypothetical protein [Streptomyces erythrochromogenes]|uniref:hypothetical protein n=1 Tax=Streptomyces erythrochromogenes TaxID=285574 RepID=UPI00386DD218|nr:hypothetical protein OG364_01380 [Streptomyces erythrochromogenes]WST98282.1 hypothetical protein OG364_40160 [Streptomyces erythrochromogenes]
MHHQQHPHQHQHPNTTPALVVVHPPQPSGTERRALLLASPLARPPRSRSKDPRGKAVTITHVHEYRVTDEDALLQAATDQGWQPLPAFERRDDDPRDLTGALMALTAHPDVPGTRTLDHQGTAELLAPGSDPDPAAEPAHRSAAPARTPDFAALFAPRDHPCRNEDEREDEREGEGEDCAGDEDRGPHRWQLTPRTADLLHTALLVLADQAYDDAHHLGDRLLPDAGPGTLEVLDRLPPLTWTADHRWRRRMARAFDDLAGDLADGHWPRPTCIAEEMALHLAVDDVPAHLEDLCEEDDHHTLPSHRDDYSHSHLLFRDQDVLMLFHTGFTGVGGPGRAAWFTPFDDRSARDPRRGFRR